MACALMGIRVSQEEAHADHAPPRSFGTLAVTFLKTRGIEPDSTFVVSARHSVTASPVLRKTRVTSVGAPSRRKPLPCRGFPRVCRQHLADDSCLGRTSAALAEFDKTAKLN
jgi:hypothetical protein